MTELDLAHIDRSGSLGDQLEAIIAALPEDHLTLGQLLQVFGDEGLLLLTILLTLVFLIPVSIPGVSTVFGAAILLVGISRVSRRPLWLPAKLRARRPQIAYLWTRISASTSRLFVAAAGCGTGISPAAGSTGLTRCTPCSAMPARDNTCPSAR